MGVGPALRRNRLGRCASGAEANDATVDRASGDVDCVTERGELLLVIDAHGADAYDTGVDADPDGHPPTSYVIVACLLQELKRALYRQPGVVSDERHEQADAELTSER